MTMMNSLLPASNGAPLPETGGPSVRFAAALRAGMARAWSRPWLWALVWVVALLPALLGSLPVLQGLGSALGTRPLAEAMVRGEADAVFTELFGDHPSLVPMGMTGATVALLLSWLSWLFLSGAVTDALRRPGDPLRVISDGVMARAARTGFAMLRLGFFGVLLRLAPLLLGGGAAMLWGKLVPGRSLVFGALLGLGLALPVLLLWSMISVVLHFARVHAVSLGADGVLRLRSAVRSVGRGLRQARRAPGRTAGLSVVSLIGVGLLLAAERQGATWLGLSSGRSPGAGPPWLGWLILWHQVLALLRAVFALGVLGAAVEVVATCDENSTSRQP